MFAHENGKYTRLELDDGTPIDVLETLQQVKDICQGKYEQKQQKLKVGQYGQ